MGNRIFAQTVGFVNDPMVNEADITNNQTLMAMLRTIASFAPRASVKSSLALDAGDQVDVFTVTNGYILLKGMAVVITEAVSAHAALIGFVHDPLAAYGASTTDIATETGSADLQSAAIGDMFCADLDATAVVKYAHATALGVVGAVNPGGLILPPGGIDITISTSNPTSGIGDVILLWRPISPTAYVDIS